MPYAGIIRHALANDVDNHAVLAAFTRSQTPNLPFR